VHRRGGLSHTRCTFTRRGCAVLFCCAGIRSLGRRLRRETARSAKGIGDLHEPLHEARERHLRKVDRRNQDQFLRSVSKVLPSEELDPAFGEEVGYDSEEEAAVLRGEVLDETPADDGKRFDLAEMPVLDLPPS